VRRCGVCGEYAKARVVATKLLRKRVCATDNACVYLRHTTRHKDGKKHVYWQLVRSVRRGRKVVQETVAQLGELDGEGRARAQVLARQISGRGCERQQGELFARNALSESVAVQVEAIHLERGRSFGAVWLGWILWRALKLDELLAELLPEKREAVAWSQVVAIPGDRAVVRAFE
jgi:hypothetical protein